MLYIGLDDTDTRDTRGTGHLARMVARALSADFPVLGVTRHQLLFDPRVPYTAKNSCAAIMLQADGQYREQVAQCVTAIMQDAFVEGSDPGLCVTAAVPAAVMDFGRRAKVELVTQAEARELAESHGVALMGLGGTNDGMIGALAAVGLAACGEDGRYVQIGGSRELAGLQTVGAVTAAGVGCVQAADGTPVREGMVLADKLRPARRQGSPVLVVEWQDDYWLPLKLD